MKPTAAIFSLILATQIVSAAPVFIRELSVRQLAGEGAACDSILSSTDNGVGYGVEDAEDNIAGNIGTAKGVARMRMLQRQLAGEGAACNSILSSTDNGVGYGVEDAEDNIAGNISGASGTAGGAAGGAGGAGGPPPTGPGAPPPPGPGASPPPPRRAVEARSLVARQGDKIANGAGAIIDAAGAPAVGGAVASNGDSVDATLTSGAANAGAEVGAVEVSTLEGAGSAVPKL